MTSSNPFSISSLVNGVPSGYPHRPSPTYGITIRQQPLSARACGFSDRDRRVIDPPPILVLHVNDPGASKEEISERLRSSFYMVHCTLWDPWTNEEVNIMPAPPGRLPQRRLIGKTVGDHFYGRDNDDREQRFFYFADLSVRTAGTYYLKFDIVVLDPLRMQASFPVCASVTSNTFTVYNARDFQGMRRSTTLTRCLRAQGCQIPVKRGSVTASASSSSGEVDSEYCKEDGDGDEGDGWDEGIAIT